MNILMKRVAVLVFTILTLTASARSAAADQIAITAGTLQMGATMGTVSIEGDRGFTLVAGVAVFDSFFAPWNQCLAPCIPGTPVSLAATFSGSSLHLATVTLDGLTFTNVGSLTSPHSAALVFTGGPVVLPVADQDLATLVTPFLFTGLFSGALLHTPDPSDTVRVDLVGQGTAALTFQRSLLTPDGSARWRYASAVYSFDAAEPIPEPATLLLTGAGLAVLARRRLSQRRGAEPQA